MIWVILKICYYIFSCFLCVEYFQNKKEIYKLKCEISERDIIIETADKDQDRLVRLLNKATGRKDLTVKTPE